MGAVARALQPRKARLQALADGVARLEQQALRAAPIPVLRVCRCGHPQCGEAMPDVMPTDALVIELGCSFEVPAITPPPGVEGQYRSRAEAAPERAIGRGLGESEVKQVIARLKVFQR